MKCVIIIILFVIGIQLHIDSKGIMDTICPPAINIYEDNIIFEDKRDSIKLNWIAIIHPQLDSMLMKITNGLKKDSNLCFYITFMRYGGKFYIEIFEDYPNNYLFDIKNKKDFLSQRLARKIYGYVKCNDIDIYLLLFPAPYEPDKETLDNLMEAKDMIVIYRNDEKYHFVQENPMWLYEYFDGNINLIKSVNDKGFFTSP